MPLPSFLVPFWSVSAPNGCFTGFGLFLVFLVAHCSELLFHRFAVFLVPFWSVSAPNGFLTVFGLFLVFFGGSLLRTPLSPFSVFSWCLFGGSVL